MADVRMSQRGLVEMVWLHVQRHDEDNNNVQMTVNRKRN